jgi:hypothetical protein
LSIIVYNDEPIRDDPPEKARTNDTETYKDRSDIIQTPIILRDEIFTAFTRVNFLPDNPHIVVPGHVTVL